MVDTLLFMIWLLKMKGYKCSVDCYGFQWKISGKFLCGTFVVIFLLRYCTSRLLMTGRKCIINIRQNLHHNST